MNKKTSRSRTLTKSVAVGKKPASLKKKKSSQLPLHHRRILGLKLHHAGGLTLLIVGVIWGVIVFASQPPVRSDAATCTPDAKLVNPCRPWLGAAVGGYDTGGQSMFQFFNTRLNNPSALNNPKAQTILTHKLDVPHIYHGPGQNLFNSNAKEALNDSSLYGHPSKPILINWKPGGSNWGATARGDSDSSIVTAAQAVKALGSRKIMLALWHEPENDNVNAEGLSITGKCTRPNGSNGSAAEYRAMWRHVREVFDRQGVSNVVWVWNPMGYVGSDGNGGWACIEDAMYPGNDLVDWIMWDPYSSGDGQFYNSVNRFYSFLNAHSTASNNYKSKPWGLAEHGSNASPAEVVDYWNAGVETIGTKWSENKFPNIKLYAVFDTSNNGGVNGGLRVGYDNVGNIDVKEQTAYNAFAKNILTFGDGTTTPSPTPAPTPTPGKDTVPPTVTFDSPAPGATVKGRIEIKATAKDNVRVKAVTLRVDDRFVASDESSPYTFTLDTAKYSNGRHELVIRAWDPRDNMGEAKTVTLNFQNGRKAPDPVAPPKPSTTTITAATTSSATTPVKVTGLLVVSPSTPGNSIQIWLDGVLQDNNTIDSAWLTNGQHTIKIVENGVDSLKLVSVHNPLPLAALNEVRASPVAYSVAAGALLAVVVLWIVRPYMFGFTSRQEQKITSMQRRIK